MSLELITLENSEPAVQFRQHAQDQEWKYSEVEKEIFNSHLEM